MDREDEVDYQEQLESETVASNPKKRKTMDTRSNAWDHFTKIMDEQGILSFGKCKYCSKELKANTSRNGTSSLRNHLKSCKSFNVEGRQTKLAFQHSSDSTSLTSWTFDKDLAREKHTKMIIVDELPFKFGEGLGFREFMATVQPMFQIPSRWTVARDYYGMYSLKRNDLKGSLHEPTQRLCLTTDTWTSNQRINYMCLTAHFIDKDWKLHKRILNFCPLISHKGKAIAMAIEECLVEWGITRVLSITVDNASSNDVALEKLKGRIGNWNSSVLNGEHLHLRCVAHILNLIVKDGLGVFDGSISRVREAVKYVRSSPARELVFMDCAKYEKIETQKSLILDVDTRWNSTYEMLDVAEKYEGAFDRLDTQDLMYKKHLKCKKTNVDKRPTHDDWITVRKFASFLKKFYDLTCKISGTSYVTSNMFLHEIYAIHAILNEWTYGSNAHMYVIGKEMLEKFEKYWGDPTQMNNLLFIAVVLDPRHKLQFVVYMLKRMYGEEVGGLIGKSLEDTMYKMFNEYKSRIASKNQRNIAREKRSEENIGQMHPSQLLRMQFEKDIGMISSDGSASDLEEYLSEKSKTFRDSDGFDILEWWRNNSMRFPVLSQMARDVLAFPISTVASESAFSTGGRVLNDFRSSLRPKMVEALICAQDWMRRTAKGINVEEDPEEMKQLDEAIEKMSLEGTSTAASATGQQQQ